MIPNLSFQTSAMFLFIARKLFNRTFERLGNKKLRWAGRQLALTGLKISLRACEGGGLFRCTLQNYIMELFFFSFFWLRDISPFLSFFFNNRKVSLIATMKKLYLKVSQPLWEVSLSK